MNTPDKAKVREIKALIASYAGRKIEFISIFEDPVFPGVYAVRVTFKAGNRRASDHAEFLLRDPLSESTIADATFETWPPQQRT